MNLEHPIGTYTENGQRYAVRVELRIEPAQGIGRGLTIEHQPIPDDAVEISLTGTVYEVKPDGTRDQRRARFETDMIAGGQIVEYVEKLNTPRARRLAELWRLWHMNGMSAGCAHQAETWTCTRDDVAQLAGRIGTDASAPCGTINGWPIVYELYGPHPHPKRGDVCHACGRERWNEPTDECPVTGYRYGTAWLYRIPPPAIVAELRAMFGQTDPSAALPGETMPRTAHHALPGEHHA